MSIGIWIEYSVQFYKISTKKTAKQNDREKMYLRAKWFVYIKHLEFPKILRIFVAILRNYVRSHLRRALIVRMSQRIN